MYSKVVQDKCGAPIHVIDRFLQCDLYFTSVRFYYTPVAVVSIYLSVSKGKVCYATFPKISTNHLSICYNCGAFGEASFPGPYQSFVLEPLGATSDLQTTHPTCMHPLYFR